MTASYEGIESGDIAINGGIINVKARDDGINAGGGNDGTTSGGPGMPGEWFNKGDTATNTNYQIIIRGGDITVDADGDGIDSNGNIFFQGGTITVNGPTNSGNGALDYGDGANCVCEISGGTLIAAGAVGMDVAPTKGSSQPAKSFQSVVMSCEKLKLGSTYTVYYGTDLNSLTKGDSVTFTSVSMSTGSSSGGGWGGPRR